MPDGGGAGVDDSDRVGERDEEREMEPVTVDVAEADDDADDVCESD